MERKISTDQKARVSKPKAAVEQKKQPNMMCLRCGVVYDKQQGNFSEVRSSFYGANNGFLHVCNKCVDELFKHYRAIFDGDIRQCIYTLCLNFNVYFSNEIYDSATKSQHFDDNPFNAYLSKAGLAQHKMWTDFTDTIDQAELSMSQHKKLFGCCECGEMS